MGAFTECLQDWWFADVLAVKDSLFTVEIEVKISRADFLGELKAMKMVLDASLISTNETKLPKHTLYLTKREVQEQGYLLAPFQDGKEKFIPNEFYFCVPQELAYMAQILIDTNSPYGLLSVVYQDRLRPFIEVVKPAKKLHNNKIEPRHLYKIISRAANENLNLRQRLLKKEETIENKIAE